MADRICWTKALSQEFWAGVVTPLMFSIAGGLIEERMAGKGLRIAGLKQLENEPFLRLLDGEVYLNSRILEEVVKRIPSILITPEVLRFLPEAVREEISRTRVSLFSPATLRMLFRVVLFEKDWAPFSNYKAFDRAARRIEQAGKAYARFRPKDLSDSDLLDRSRTLYREMGDFLEVVIWGVVFAYVARPLTERLARDWGEDSQGERAACLRVGLAGIRTFEINREIEILADEVAGDPCLNEWFDSSDPEEILTRLRGEAEGAAFLKRFEAFLERHGHRFLGRDIRHATWRERPEAVIDMIGMNRGSNLCRKTLERQRERSMDAEKALKSRINRGVLGLPKWALFSLLLSYDRKYFVLRENMRYLADVYLEQFRRLYWEIGRRWQSEGILRGAEEIVFLRREEIEEAHKGRTDVSHWVAKRKREYRQARRAQTPEIIREDENPSVAFTRLEEGRIVLQGEVASPGRVTGPARIIREPTDLLGFRKGDILVARSTDPSWAPVLPLAAGLVLEVGGILSHGSIVAREYGIPALIQAEGALEKLRNGDRLELDTDRKRVRVFPRPLPPT
jgi:pyruvate,water dikinase